MTRFISTQRAARAAFQGARGALTTAIIPAYTLLREAIPLQIPSQCVLINCILRRIAMWHDRVPPSTVHDVRVAQPAQRICGTGGTAADRTIHQYRDFLSGGRLAFSISACIIASDSSAMRHCTWITCITQGLASSSSELRTSTKTTHSFLSCASHPSSNLMDA